MKLDELKYNLSVLEGEYNDQIKELNKLKVSHKEENRELKECLKEQILLTSSTIKTTKLAIREIEQSNANASKNRLISVFLWFSICIIVLGLFLTTHQFYDFLLPGFLLSFLTKYNDDLMILSSYTFTLGFITSLITLVLKVAKEYDKVIYCSYNACFNPSQAELINSLEKENLAVIAIRTPYDLNVLDVDTYLCSYEASVQAFIALSKVLTASIPATGKVPVTLNTNK
jgi:hypothetical protein